MLMYKLLFSILAYPGASKKYGQLPKMGIRQFPMPVMLSETMQEHS
ncbi:hypothetical protein J43TS9_21100 [Paenibacillus cineris]|nr:hypothetical protein J43TS9_21100 [Paenibacillus cineris]